jgi:hypothetical protein
VDISGKSSRGQGRAGAWPSAGGWPVVAGRRCSGEGRGGEGARRAWGLARAALPPLDGQGKDRAGLDKELVQLKGEARLKGGFYVSPKAKLLFVVRICSSRCAQISLKLKQ